MWWKTCWLMLLAAAALTMSAPASSANDPLSGPAMGDGESLDEHHGQSEDIHDLRGESDDPGDREATSHDPDEFVVDSEDIQDLEADSEQLADHEGHSSQVQDLVDADEQVERVERETMATVRERHRREELAEEAAKPAHRAVDPSSGNRMNAQIAAVHAAKADLREARERVKRADAVYANMLERDYPRGEARLEIVDERKLAHEDLQRTEQAYDAALGGGGPASN